MLHELDEYVLKSGAAVKFAQALRGIDAEYLAAIDEGDPMAVFSLRKIMGGDEYCGARIGNDLDKTPECLARSRINP